MVNILKYCSVLLCLIVFTRSANAVEVKDLYLVKWPVSEQSKSARWKAALEGFREVLVRKSGSVAILQSFEAKQAYSKVTNYLQRFEYERQADIGAKEPYVISLYFEPRLIDTLIQDAKMPLWGANRPVTIMWVAVEEEFKRRILKDNQLKQLSPNVTNKSQLLEQSNSDVTNPEVDNLEFDIQKNAIRRGIPVILPLMDLDDELVVSISDIWGLFPSTIAEASQRYSADSALFGRIKKQGEQWYGNFGYLNQKDQFNFEIIAKTSKLVVADMINRLSELLCNKYCVIEEIGKKNEIVMRLSNVNNFEEFKASEKYLKGLSSLDKIEVIKIDQYSVIYKLTLLGQVESLAKGIELSRKMIIDEETEKSESKRLLEEQELLQEQQLNQQVLENNKILSSKDINLTKKLNPAPNQNYPTVEQEENGLKTHDNARFQNIKSNKNLRTLYYRWIG